MRLAELLNRHSDYRVRLEGHADHIGSDSYNIALGRKRAETVRDFPVKYGAQASRSRVDRQGPHTSSRPSRPEGQGTPRDVLIRAHSPAKSGSRIPLAAATTSSTVKP